MADAKLSALSALAGSGVAAGDLLYIDDVSAGASGSKSIVMSDVLLAVAAVNGNAAVTWTQPVATTGAPTLITFTGGAHTGLTASAEITDVNVNLARTVQRATGAVTTQRSIRVQPPTFSFVGASTITEAVTLAVEGPPVAGTNATITRAYSAIVTGLTCVRQSGGTAGTDELQFSHDGAQALIESKDGRLVFTSPTQQIFNADGAARFVMQQKSGGGDQINTGNNGNYGWVSGAAVGAGNAHDTSLFRVAAGIVGVTGTTTTAGWIQNSAGRVTLTSNYTNATTTFSNTSLSATVVAGRKYSGRVVLRCSDSTAAEGIKFDFNGGSATMTSFNAGVVSNIQGATAGTTISAALATAINFSAMNGTTDHWIVIEFQMTVNAGGTFILRGAQNSHTSGTATIGTGSSMLIEDMP